MKKEIGILMLLGAVLTSRAYAVDPCLEAAQAKASEWVSGQEVEFRTKDGEAYFFVVPYPGSNYECWNAFKVTVEREGNTCRVIKAEEYKNGDDCS